MAGITAAQVKELREKTGLPMMDCKKALGECNGDADAAVQWLRERGAQVLSRRVGRETSFGRFGLYCRFDPPVGAMVELQCESAPVTQNEEFIQLANDLAEQLAVGPGRRGCRCPARPAVTQPAGPDPARADGRAVQPDPRGVPGGTPGADRRRLRRLHTPRRDGRRGAVGGRGRNPRTGRDICMHITAMRPAALTVEDLDTRRSWSGARHPAGSRFERRQAGVDRRQDGRRALAQLLRRTGTAGAAVRQGRRQADGGQFRRGARYAGQAFRPLGTRQELATPTKESPACPNRPLPSRRCTNARC
jgi:elongation factor Ts